MIGFSVVLILVRLAGQGNSNKAKRIVSESLLAVAMVTREFQLQLMARHVYELVIPSILYRYSIYTCREQQDFIYFIQRCRGKDYSTCPFPRLLRILFFGYKSLEPTPVSQSLSKLTYLISLVY
jgi:hypothetical protein